MTTACLVVDDSSVIRKVARRILESLDFQIVEAEDGAKALDACKRAMSPKGVRLGDASWMCDPAAGDDFADYANARRVFAALSSGFMPPGHKWSQDRLDTYSSWISDGFQP